MFPLINPLTILAAWRTAGTKMIVYAVLLLLPWAAWMIYSKIIRAEALKKSDDQNQKDEKNTDDEASSAEKTFNADGSAVDKTRQNIQ